jgi:hypothetical protein
MIQVSTFIGILLSFFITTVLAEKYYQKNSIKTRLRTMILYIMAYMFVLLTFVVLVPQVFPILIFGSVVMASFFNVYNRHRRIPGEVEA